ncbi:NAD-dependent epimerase/dehydratase family protein [Azospirillum agricola]|uniref:NAD-dependent epimerase/dehydratase family protein n=1 Tax=Azospirillum agricola TaxID=1720247 RepID=UPI000A0F38A8|nr:NAD-dependent epimerase/dehydratase family protein [Azospirillum agricola]SMH41515.1 UDP-glucose 4-epimerase [Azospirillum lipoferum]
MRVFITGGAGFIGSNLADRLLARGDAVMVVDNYATGRRDNLKAHEHLTMVEGSITDGALVRALVGDFKPDLIVHAAASYKDPEDWAGDALVNGVGTANIVKAARDSGCGRVIYFQTALCYGLKPLEQPITLAHPILPGGSSYAISKTAGEHYIQLSGLDHVSFRLANAYGPRNLSGPLPTFYHRLTTGKPCFVTNTRRDFIYIDDLVDCVVSAVDGRGHGAYHISSGSDYSISELFNEAVRALRINLEQPVEVRERHPDDAYTILLDPSRTGEEFGWQIRTPLGDGVSRTIDWYREHGITQTFTHLIQSKE